MCFVRPDISPSIFSEMNDLYLIPRKLRKGLVPGGILLVD